jgi:hypothetical protein
VKKVPLLTSGVEQILERRCQQQTPLYRLGWRAKLMAPWLSKLLVNHATVAAPKFTSAAAGIDGRFIYSENQTTSQRFIRTSTFAVLTKHPLI